MFYDEAFFRRESSVIRGWYPKGQKTILSSPASFEKVGVCGAVNPRNGKLYSLILNGFDSETFIYYLKWLIKIYRGKKKIVLVLDNASSHKSKKVKDFVNGCKDKLELCFLPPYSPHLNLIEQLDFIEKKI